MSAAPVRFAANLSILFTERPLLERPRAAAAAGFQAVEAWWPFADPVPTDREVARFEEAIGDAGVSLVALNLDGGDLAAGERGIASLPGMDQRFADNLACALEIAARQQVRVMNALYGNALEASAAGTQRELAIARLGEAGRKAEAAGVRIVVETQNRVDSPLYPLRAPADVVALIGAVSEASGARLGWLCDLYHLAMEGHDPALAIEQHFPLIAHVQVADSPGRHEPGTGTIDFVGALGRLVALGYDGFVACEYRPSATTEESFTWRPSLEAALSDQSHGQEEERA